MHLQLQATTKDGRLPAAGNWARIRIGYTLGGGRMADHAAAAALTSTDPGAGDGGEGGR